MADINTNFQPGETNPYASPKSELGRRELIFDDPSPRNNLEPFSIDSVLTRAWAIFKQRPGIIMGVVLGGLGINIGFQLGAGAIVESFAAGRVDSKQFWAVLLIENVCFFAFQSWIQAGQTLALLKVARNRDAGIDDLFQGGRYFLRFCGATLLCILITIAIAAAAGLPATLAVWALSPSLGPIAIGLVLLFALIGIGLIMAMMPRLYQFPYVLIDQDCGTINALTTSFTITKGYVIELLALGLLAGLISVSGILACGLGLLVTIPIGLMIPPCAYVLLVGEARANRCGRLRTDLEFLDFES